MRLIHRSVARLLQRRVPNDFAVATVSLSHNRAAVVSNLTRINPESRRKLRSLVPYSCSGTSVDLQAGIHAAISVCCQ